MLIVIVALVAGWWVGYRRPPLTGAGHANQGIGQGIGISFREHVRVADELSAQPSNTRSQLGESCTPTYVVEEYSIACQTGESSS
jgi:hypothetical protein